MRSALFLMNLLSWTTRNQSCFQRRPELKEHGRLRIFLCAWSLNWNVKRFEIFETAIKPNYFQFAFEEVLHASMQIFKVWPQPESRICSSFSRRDCPFLQNKNVSSSIHGHGTRSSMIPGLWLHTQEYPSRPTKNTHVQTGCEYQHVFPFYTIYGNFG